MSSFHRLKIGGVFAGIILFFVINKIRPSPAQHGEVADTFKTDFDQTLHKTKYTLSQKKQQNNQKRQAKEQITGKRFTTRRQDFSGQRKGLNKEDISLLSKDDYTNFLYSATEGDLQDPYVNQHKYKFILNNKHACDGEVFVVTLIHSAPNKWSERWDIRDTWGSVQYYSGAVLVPIFLLAQTENNTLQGLITKESRTYGDIIQGNFLDSYRNLTYKNVMGLHWVRTHCTHAKFVLKVDDDTMVDVYHLVNFLFQKSPDGNLVNFLYCSIFKNQGPRRTKHDKWYVSEEVYPYRKYPPYCEGFAYIMSADVTQKLYEASKSVQTYWVDDVYVTGFLALKSDIYHRNMENGHSFHLMTSQHLSKHAQTSIFLLAKYANLRKNWNKAWNDIQIINSIGE